LDAALGADAVTALDPAGAVELLVRRCNVELADIEARARLRVHGLGCREDVAGRLAGESVTVEARGDRAAVARHRERAANGLVAEERVLRVRLTAPVAQRRARVAEVHEDALDARSVHGRSG